jgi:hypothetical protein
MLHWDLLATTPNFLPQIRQVGFAAVLSGVIHKESHALSYGVEVGVVTGLSSGILVAVTPAVEAWVDDLPDRSWKVMGPSLF